MIVNEWLQTHSKSIKQFIVFSFAMISMQVAIANPEGGVVTSGTATITQAPNVTQINQATDKAIIEWNSFNIGAQEKTQFIQPNSSSITLNRINPNQGASQIFGQLSANGRIVLVNQAGIFFGPSAVVDVSGIIASTSNITNANFLAGKFIFDQPSTLGGSVINQGTIIAANNGLIALIGNGVSNEGYIQANLGNVVLASGNKFTVDLAGDELINFSIDEATVSQSFDQDHRPLKNSVNNSGTIMASGGRILLSAKSAAGIVDHVINMKGVLEARSVTEKDGVIILDANQGDVVVEGTLDASSFVSTGGTIKILGNHIRIDSGSVIDASGLSGGGEILIGGNFQGKGPEANALSVYVAPNATLKANAMNQGNGGKIIIWSDGMTQFHGAIFAQGGAQFGNGGFAETSGHYLDVTNATANLLATHGLTGTWLLDPTDVAINASADVNSSLNGTTYQPTDGTLATSVIDVTNLQNALLTSNVLVTTTPFAGSGGAGTGNITVNTPITWSSANTLSFTADNQVILNADITGTNGGITSNSSVLLGTNITLTGATINLQAVDLSSNLLTVTTTGTSAIAGLISGTGGITKNGAGTLALSNTTNTYTGQTTINAGTLSITAFANGGSPSSLGSTPASTPLLIGSSSPATLDYGTNAFANFNRLITINGTGGGTISLTAGLTTFTGNIDTSGNPLTFNLLNTLFYQGVISGGGAVTKTGSGNLFMTGANTYTGETFINAGRVDITNASALGASSAGTTIANSAQLVAHNITLAEPLSVSGSGSGSQGAVVGENVILSGNIILNANSIFAAGTTSNGPGNLSITGNISGNFILRLGGIGTGTFTLSGNNSFTGGIFLSRSLTVGSATAIPSTGGFVFLNSIPTTLDLNGFDLTLGSLDAGDSSAIVSLGSQTLTIGGDNTSSFFSGVITGTGAVIKTGSGDLYLDGTNTYSGLTTINDGILIAASDSALGSPLASTIVNSGATLQIEDANIASEDVTLNGGTLQSYGTSSLGGNITLTAPSIIATTDSSNSFTITGTINGASDLTFNNLFDPSFVTTISNTIGNTTPLTSITSNADNLRINTSSIITTGNQTYNAMPSILTDTTFTTSTGTLNFPNGIEGNGNNITLNGGNGSQFILANPSTINNLTVNGLSNNTLQVTTNDLQTWNINTSNTGTITNITGVNGTFTFTDIANLTSGTNNDTFTFADGASVTGTISGGGGTNDTLNYSLYSSPISLLLSTTDNAGSVQDNGSTTITNYNSFQNVIGSADSSILLPIKTNTIYITGGGSGYINDPTNFSSFTSFTGQGTSNVIFNVPYTFVTATSVNVNGVIMNFTNITFTPNDPVTPNNAATINTVISGTAFVYSPQVTSSNPASTVNNDSSDTTSETNADFAFTPVSFTVTPNIEAMINQQSALDTEIRENQSFGCT